jgi:hypothetical protein
LRYLEALMIAACLALAGAGTAIIVLHWNSGSPRLMTGGIVWAAGGIIAGCFLLARALGAREKR